MSFFRFLKSKILAIFLFACFIVFSSSLLHHIGLNAYPIFFLDSFLIFILLILFIKEYFTKASYYNSFYKIQQELDKTFLMAEVIDRPNFLEGEIIYEVLKTSLKGMNDEIALYKNMSLEYREYIESWVHEIKTPIAAARLLIENNPGQLSGEFETQLTRIEDYIQQALFYARADSVEKDYFIKETSLEEFIKHMVKKNASTLIQKKINIELNNLDFTVFSDMKWLEFIFDQFFSNSIRYTPDKGTLRFYAEKRENNVVLYMEDSGIGISQGDLARIFEKSFTGENGRKFQKSTGMGLYLAKKLSDKLGITLSAASEENKGTTIAVTFPKNKLVLLEG